MEAIPDEVRLDFRQNPCTEVLRAIIDLSQEYIRHQWSTGQFTSEEMAGTLQRNAEAIGGVNAFNGVLELLDEIEGRPSDD